MAERVRAALTHAQDKQLKNLNVPHAEREIKQIMTTVQQFVDEYQEHFEEGSLNIFALEAYPNRRTGTAQTAFVLVNMTGRTVTDLEADLALSVADFGVEFEPVHWEIGRDFLGNWGNHLAIMVVDEVPMEGTATQTSYHLGDLDLHVENVSLNFH